MFHRAKNETESSESSAVENSSEKQENAPQNINNSNQPIKKDEKPMNAQAENKDEKSTENQSGDANARVDIPNNNFQRTPAQATGQPSRPAYPGSYPGSTGGSGYSMSSTGGDSERKLMIGKGITLSGEIEECEHLIVDGTVEATLKGGNVLDISESGAFYGTVEIEEANIAGKFEGDITVSGRLTIQSTGQISGTISYKELAVEVGASVDGTIAPIGSANANKISTKKTGSKSSKASTDSSAELPFSGAKSAA